MMVKPKIRRQKRDRFLGVGNPLGSEIRKLKNNFMKRNLSCEEIMLLQKHSLQQMAKAGYLIREIAKLCGVSGSTIWWRLKEYRIKRRGRQRN